MFTRVGIGYVELDCELCNLVPVRMYLFGEGLFLRLHLLVESLLKGFDLLAMCLF